MERLTEYVTDAFGAKRAWLKEPTKKSICTDCKSDCSACSFRQVVEKLAAYEDAGLEPVEVLPKKYADEIMMSMILLKEYQNIGSIDHFQKLAQAEK